MSYTWGANGNDLDWESMMFLNVFTEELELAIFRGEAELDEDGYVTDEYCMAISDSNPTMIYYDGEELNIQQMLKDGKKLDDCLEWYIVHDTNGNFVDLVGDVPDKYLREEYIQERNQAEGER